MDRPSHHTVLEDLTPHNDAWLLRSKPPRRRSDWHGWMGHDPDIELPHVPGHEFAGVVAAVGKNVKGFKPGDRVTAPLSAAAVAAEIR